MVVIMVAATSNISPLSSSSSFVHPRYNKPCQSAILAFVLVPYYVQMYKATLGPFHPSLSLSPKTSLCCRKRHACSVWSYQVMALHTDRENEQVPLVVPRDIPACCWQSRPYSVHHAALLLFQLRRGGGDGKFHTGGVLRRRGGVHRTHVITLLGGIQREQPGASIPLGH